MNERPRRPRPELAHGLRRSWRGILLCLPALALLAGCSAREDYRGAILDPERVSQLKNGVKTRDQVMDLLGSPSAKSTFSEASDTWYYISSRTETLAFFAPKITQRSVLAVDFDTAGRVDKVRHYELEDGRDVAIVDRVTETSGREFGLLEQLFGNIGRFNNSGKGGAGSRR